MSSKTYSTAASPTSRLLSNWMIKELAVLLGVMLAAPPIHAATQVVAWGNTNWWTDIPPPPGLTNVIAIGASHFRDLALKADGTVVAWGLYQAEVPRNLTNVVAISSGSDGHNLALKSDGTVVAWGDNSNGQTNVPRSLTNVVAIAAGGRHNLALRADGKVIAWGYNDFGNTDVPTDLSDAVAIAAGAGHSLALKADGTVVAWGSNQFGELEIPVDLSNVVAIATSLSYNLALKTDGTIESWGTPRVLDRSLHFVPPAGLTNVVAIAGAFAYSLALKADGTVVRWGDPEYDAMVIDRQSVTNVPPSLTNVVAIAAGHNHNLALVGDGRPFLTSPLVNRTAAYGETIFLRMTATGAWPLSYQWKFNGAELPNATNGLLALSAVKYDQAGTYSVVVTDTLAQTTGAEMSLAVVPLLLTDPPQGQITFLGGTAEFRAAAAGEGALAYQWEFNGKDLAGAANRTLVLTNAQFSQSGSYRLIVSNRLATVRSIDANLSVTPVAAWGGDVNSTSQKNVPANLTNVLMVSGGNAHTLALRDDGTVAAWPAPASVGRRTDVPDGLKNVVAVAAGGYHSLALKADGAVAAWGHNTRGQTNVPPNLVNVVAIAGGGEHSLALKADGTVVAWGEKPNVPPGLTNVVAIDAGYGFSLALKEDGTVVAWGDNSQGQTKVPTDLKNVTAIATGDSHSLALKADGTVAGWGSVRGNSGDYDLGQSIVLFGLSNVVAIAAGNSSLALKADGTVIAWGRNERGQTNVPTELRNVTTIAAGDFHHLALVGDGPPLFHISLTNPARDSNGFSVSLATQSGKVYRLEYKNSLANSNWTPLPLAAGNGHVLTLTDSSATASQRFYRVRRW